MEDGAILNDHVATRANVHVTGNGYNAPPAQIGDAALEGGGHNTISGNKLGECTGLWRERTERAANRRDRRSRNSPVSSVLADRQEKGSDLQRRRAATLTNPKHLWRPRVYHDAM